MLKKYFPELLKMSYVGSISCSPKDHTFFPGAPGSPLPASVSDTRLFSFELSLSALMVLTD